MRPGYKKWILLGSLFILPFGLFAEKSLKLSDVRPSMDQLFAYHVENRSFSPLIVKRSVKVFIEQFDSEKFYLLKGEIKPFLDLSDSRVSGIISQYAQDQFDIYQKLNNVMENAIDRHRRLREEVMRELISSKETSDSILKDESFTDYSTTEAELKRRIKARYIKILQIREKRSQEELTKERKSKILALLEKKLRRMESGYYVHEEVLSEDALKSKREHYLAMHILKAVSKSLDAHSAYYSPEEAAELRTSLKKQFHGIGIVLRESEEGIYIADLVTGGPAYNSEKVKVGDYLIGIDGKSLAEASFDEVLDALRGDEGTSLELHLKRQTQAYKIKLKREKILLNEERLSYTYEPYADGIIGKIVLPGFYDNGEGVNAEKDLREALKELKSKGTLYGIVIDMRENSGGFLSQAVKVAGVFITKGIIVISKYANGEIRYIRDLDGKFYYQGPVVVLTSKASASAAEIVAQALQDYGVALVVGDERTYGKGSMQYQTVTDDDAKAYFKVTVGRYYTISGRSTQIDGVKADIVVPTVFAPFNIGERYLEYPLSTDQLDIESTLAQIGKQELKQFQKKGGTLQESKTMTWINMLPALKKNSEQRLLVDQNFQCFLRKTQGDKQGKLDLINKKRGATRADDLGQEDLQTKESVNILKDMIMIQLSEK